MPEPESPAGAEAGQPSRLAESIWASLPSALSVALSLLLCLLMIAVTKGMAKLNRPGFSGDRFS